MTILLDSNYAFLSKRRFFFGLPLFRITRYFSIPNSWSNFFLYIDNFLINYIFTAVYSIKNRLKKRENGSQLYEKLNNYLKRYKSENQFRFRMKHLQRFYTIAINHIDSHKFLYKTVSRFLNCLQLFNFLKIYIF